MMPKASTSNHVIRLRNVTKVYESQGIATTALDGIDLSIRRGELAAVVGPSGSGKSTLMNIAGLLERPSSGEVHVGDRATVEMSDRALTKLRGEHIGFVFQFHHLLPELSAVENVMLPQMAAQGKVRRQDMPAASAILQAMGMGDKLRRRPGQLSGGEQQRVAIARALSMQPMIVLADEPTGNLDTRTSAGIMRLLRRRNRAQGTTILLVTHDLGLAERCPRVIEIVDGRIAGDRPGRAHQRTER